MARQAEHPAPPKEENDESVQVDDVEATDVDTDDNSAWDPENLTLAQIASVKYQPLGGKG